MPVRSILEASGADNRQNNPFNQNLKCLKSLRSQLNSPRDQKDSLNRSKFCSTSKKSQIRVDFPAH